MHILKRLLRLPFVRNLSGAAVGAVIALVLYGAYGVSMKVAASLLPGSQNETTEADLQAKRDAKLIETALRAKAIAEEVE